MDQDLILLKLSQGKYAAISPEDVVLISRHKWYFKPSGRTGYAVSSKLKVTLHRFLLNPPKGFQVDHINGDGLDNRRENLRLCTSSQNSRNARLSRTSSTGLKGVQYLPTEKRIKRWRARICFNGKNYFLGCFKTKEEASEAYNEAAKSFFGEFAKTNG